METILVPGTRVSDLTVADLGPWEDDKHPPERKQGAQGRQDIRVAQAVAQTENRRLAEPEPFRHEGDQDPQTREPHPSAASATAVPPSRQHQDRDVPAAPPRSGPGMSRTVPRRPPVRPVWPTVSCTRQSALSSALACSHDARLWKECGKPGSGSTKVGEKDRIPAWLHTWMPARHAKTKKLKADARNAPRSTRSSGSGFEGSVSMRVGSFERVRPSLPQTDKRSRTTRFRMGKDDEHGKRPASTPNNSIAA